MPTRRRAPVRVVAPDERAPEPEGPVTVLGAARTGDGLAALYAMRDVIAKAIDDGPPARDLAALTKRLREVMQDIATEETALEEVAQNGGASTDEKWEAV